MKIIYTIIVILLSTTVAANAYEIVDTVTEVIDGDTFKTVERGKPIIVRIADIDCPELQQPGGEKAKQYSTKILLGTLISIKTSGEKKNGILTGRITSNRGKDMAVLLTKKGLAWAEPGTKNKLVSSQQNKAIANKVGIWASQNPEPPWEYRNRTRKSIIKKKPTTRISLYGDSVMDIPRDPDGSAVGNGGGMTITSSPESKPTKVVKRKLQELSSSVADEVTLTRQQPQREKHITADDYRINLSARQSGDYVEFSGRISDGPRCESLRVVAFASSDQGGRAKAEDVVSFSSGVRSKTFDGKYRYPWYKTSRPKPQWQVTKVYASCN